MAYDGIDRKIIELLQGDIPLTHRPFNKLADQLGIGEKEVVNRVSKMRDQGLIRRWGAILRHQAAGYSENAMVAWRIEPESADHVGSLLAAYKEVSHCYLRQVPQDFGYNLFTMVHASEKTELKKVIDDMAGKSGIKDYLVLKSLKEFKKASMKYI
ncbi:MAG: Lrp/AsnC family transcriptional regulator [Syntrophomonadaceae bacterium]|jgi:DNA-binding Lrp family transcriptional regulator